MTTAAALAPPVADDDLPPPAPTHASARQAMNRIARERFRRHCRPQPRLTLSAHAERFRRIGEVPWRNDAAPYLVPIMDAIGDRTTQEIVVIAPSQSGKSEACVLNPILYFIHQEPSSILLVYPAVEYAEAFSKNRIAAMIRDCDILHRLVGPARSRDSNNTIRAKAYPGGELDITGANAPGGLAMHPKRVVLLDERDRHPRSAGTEGDVKAIARARTRRYGRRRKIVEVSSPTDEESSLIYPSYLEGTREIAELPCPKCETFQPPVFERLRWEIGATGQVDPSSVVYVCAACEHRIPASQQGVVKRAVRVRQTAEPSQPFKRSFWIHGLVAAFHDWVEIAQEFVSANRQADPADRAEKLRAFFNTTLGELYKDQQTESAKSEILVRARAYVAGDGPDVWHVPREAAVLACGCDLQHDRGELVVRAFGVGEESWLIERAVLRGDTSQPAWWAQLEDYRTRRTWLHEGGARLSLRSLAIDAGDGTHARAVYAYAAPRIGQHVYAIKGHSNPAAPMVPLKYTKVKPGRLYVIGVNAIMDRLYRRLAMPERGPGYLHFNEYADEDYVTQLLSMRRRIDERTRKRRWEATPGVRNEVPDAETYAYAAFLLGPVPAASLAQEVDRVNAEGKLALASGTTAPTPPPAPRSRVERLPNGSIW